MSGQHPPKPALPPGSIDFEATAFDTARQALDELPSGVLQAKQAQPGYWQQMRRKPMVTDRALTGLAMDWVIGLTPALRPHATCEQFPRVVNAIASAWVDIGQSLRVLDHMIEDYRGGRRGFPESVRRELGALRAHQSARSGR